MSNTQPPKLNGGCMCHLDDTHAPPHSLLLRSCTDCWDDLTDGGSSDVTEHLSPDSSTGVTKSGCQQLHGVVHSHPSLSSTACPI